MKSALEHIRPTFTAFLALAITCGFFWFLWTLLHNEIPDGNAEAINTAAGFLYAAFGAAIGFYFGSSLGSKSKEDAMIGASTNPPRPDTL